MKSKNEILLEFERLSNEKDSDAVWDFITEGYSAIGEVDQIYYYTKLLEYTWHGCHDSIVHQFQSLANPKTIEILYQTALNVEIEEFDHKPIARKCTHALSSIGTDSAKQKLIELSKCGNAVIEGYAIKRLDKWKTPR